MGLALAAGGGDLADESIVAFANIGLVLLMPACSCANAAPFIGPIEMSGAARAGLALPFSARFRDADARDRHSAI